MKKNRLFFILFILFALCLNNLNASIVYTDITDGVPNGIDFNQDGTNEFDIDTYGMSFPGDNLSYYDYGADNNIHAIDADHWDIPACVIEGFTIDASCNWLGYGDCAINGWGGPGNSTLATNQDNFMCMRFNIGANVYYGWVRFYYDGSSVTYKDYAYNDVPNGSINAGDMGSSTILVNNIQINGAGNQNEITVLNGSLQMYATVLPANADDNSVTWSVENNTGTATINQTGLLQAVSDGNVTVKATANDGSGVYGTLVVTISNQTVLVTNIQVTGAGNQTNISTQGGTLQMYATIYPENADNSSVSWSVINTTGSANINQSGLLEAISDGMVTVKATANDGSGIYGTLEITITNQSVGFNSNENEQICIYPNPSYNIINISGNNKSNSELKIYSVNGKIVMTKKIIDSNSAIDISNFENGIYFIYIESKGEIIYKNRITKI